jgi:RND family efflux transporter MFP subunit
MSDAPGQEHVRMKASGRAISKVLLAVALAGAVVVMMLWLVGAFHKKVPSESRAAAAASGLPTGFQAVAARLIEKDVIESAVGTIRPVYESSVASKVLEKVQAVLVKAGQAVKKDEVLVRLDGAVLKSRLDQAQAGVKAAEAAQADANQQFLRIRDAFAKGAVTPMERDTAGNALNSALANLDRARQAADEANTTLAFATVRSPIDGTVIDKKVNEGDMVMPGQVLVALYDPSRMQLVAGVRESLARRLAVGQDLAVNIEALNLPCVGQVTEIVPEAQAASRSFLVKVGGPCHPGVYAGMFGRLDIPIGKERVLVVPRSAVRRVGQVDMVDVVEAGLRPGESPTGGPPRAARRAVMLGRAINGDVEVLSGLREGEQVLTPSNPKSEIRNPPAAAGPRP